MYDIDLAEVSREVVRRTVGGTVSQLTLRSPMGDHGDARESSLAPLEFIFIYFHFEMNFSLTFRVYLSNRLPDRGMSTSSMMGRPHKLADWEIDAAEYMARTGASLTEAATFLGVQIPSKDVDIILRRKSFHKLLWEARHRFFNELAKSPNWNKDTAIGKLMALAQKLEEDQSYDKAAEVIFKAAKMADWVGPESTVSVFGELSQRDLDAIRESVQKEAVPKVN